MKTKTKVIIGSVCLGIGLILIALKIDPIKLSLNIPVIPIK